MAAFEVFTGGVPLKIFEGQVGEGLCRPVCLLVGCGISTVRDIAESLAGGFARVGE